MIREAVYAAFRGRIAELAVLHGTDVDRRVFVLGPFDASSMPLLEAVRDALRSRYGYTAFLESEFLYDVGLKVKCNVLTELSVFAVFVITSAGKDRGWQVEIGDLLGEGRHNAGKIGVYYEDFNQMSGPAQDIVASSQIRHAPRVVPGDPEKTLKYLLQAVNTFFFEATL